MPLPKVNLSRTQTQPSVQASFPTKPSNPSPKTPNGWKIEPALATHYSEYRNNPTPKTRSNLVSIVSPVIDRAVKTYGAAGGVNAVSEARKIVAHAIDRYDPTSGPLAPYLYSHLQGLQRTVAKQTSAIRAPERVQIDAQRLQKAADELRIDLGREPSDVELADRASMSLKRIHHVRNYNSGMSEGQFSGQQSAEGDDASFEPSVTSSPNVGTYVDFLYHDLDPVDQAILDMGFGRNGRKAQAMSKIAEHLRISTSAVSQRANRINQKLLELMQTKMFG